MLCPSQHPVPHTLVRPMAAAHFPRAPSLARVARPWDAENLLTDGQNACTTHDLTCSRRVISARARPNPKCARAQTPSAEAPS